MAMRHFHPDTWDLIRRVIKTISPSNPFWQIDPELGLHPWVGKWQPNTPP
jgi:hypothetical protein